MKRFVAIAGAALLWAGCNERKEAPAEAPVEPTAEATGTGGAGTAGMGTPFEPDRPFIGDTQIITGKIERVETGSIQMRSPDGERITFTVHPNTVLVIDGEERTLGELREGTEIRAAFDPSPTPAGDSAEGASEIQIETLPAQP